MIIYKRKKQESDHTNFYTGDVENKRTCLETSRTHGQSSSAGQTKHKYSSHPLATTCRPHLRSHPLQTITTTTTTFTSLLLLTVSLGQGKGEDCNWPSTGGNSADLRAHLSTTHLPINSYSHRWGATGKTFQRGGAIKRPSFIPQIQQPSSSKCNLNTINTPSPKLHKVQCPSRPNVI